ncbi:hypothetical protein KC845_04180 [Candidatus Kaiserbacteria bacterium]|nr:hypothetical protein [Candidatus Kaiserbacteria bacterium]
MINITQIKTSVFVLMVLAMSSITFTPVEAWNCDSLVATPSKVAPGEEVVLKWNTHATDISYVTVDKIPGEQFPVNGSAKVYPTETTTYTAHMHKDGRDDTRTCSTKVVVEIPPTPECTLDIDESSLPADGGDVVLTWTTKNADSVSFNQAIGEVDKNGSRTENVTVNTNFILTATGHGETVQCTKPVVLEKRPAPECTLVADKTEVAIGGGDVVLTWTTKNADSVSFNQAIGEVDKNGSRTENVVTSKNYVLTATGENGTVECPVSITVPDTPDPLTCSDVNFKASASKVNKNTDVTLSWNWNNKVDSASIDNGVGDVSNNGSKVVNVSKAITYNITIKNADSEKTCPVPITINTGGGGGGGSSSPRCELEISKSTIKLGESVDLKWDSSRASEVVITDNYGKTIVDSGKYIGDEKEEYFDGKITLTPTKDTTYKMVASRGSRDDECSVKVKVGDSGVTVSQIRNQDPIVAGISLTQVPYTGFEAGPLLTFIFYTLLTLWAAFVAYLFAIRRDSFGGVQFAGNGEVTNDLYETKKAEVAEQATARFASATAAPAKVESVVAEVPTNLPVATNVAPVIGYQASYQTQELSEDELELNELENRAHAQKALLSSDAMRYLLNTEPTLEAQALKLDAVIRVAKVTFPTEDGWIILNLPRMEALLGDMTKTEEVSMVSNKAVTTSGSLAEAIVTGNIVAAYEMISNRPMVALADAASDLDALYRSRKGGNGVVSDLLHTETAKLSDEQIEAMISALTSAIDGTYTDEASAVKMAIMKAVKVVA